MNHDRDSNERQAISQNFFCEAGADDRIYCRDCRNLVDRVCTAWREARAIKGYAPDADIPRRCDAYRPGQDEQDQRNGRERWPTLNRRIVHKEARDGSATKRR